MLKSVIGIFPLKQECVFIALIVTLRFLFFNES